MKNLYFVLIFILILGMVLLPLVATGAKKGADFAKPLEPSADSAEVFLIYDSATEKIIEMSEREYIFGVVAAEMPASYHPQALKAQVVAAYTYACYKRQNRLASGGEYDLSADSAADQGFISSDKLSQKWGDKKDEYTKKINDALDEVLGYVLTYEGKPIFAAYHAISGGKTEKASNVWDKDYPYLQPTESVGDLLCPTYLSETQFSSADFCTALSKLVTLQGEPASWLGEIKRSDSGTVLGIALGDKTLTGKQLRSALELRSANFDIAYSEGTFKLTVRGYGHGVGMSQYGANYMALQGSTFIEILAWYYKDCTLQK